ncbi:MAG TPA: J domain-containing protein [Bacteroidetes bacterium]|nr:J domain-containing protein [Bacteroidota bacterium]HEX04190.1 J domain-containing protein [Bacteroidota bacterium]
MPGKKHDYYAELGVQPDASQDDIRSAYRSLAKKYHPDLHHGDSRAKRRFQKIGEAYRTLSDPESRMKYHSSQGMPLREKAERQASRAPDMSKEGETFGVILKRAFKAGMGILSRDGSDKPKPQRGRNLHTTLALSPVQMAEGGKFLLKIRRDILCTGCAGAGVRPGGHGAECERCLGLGEIPSSKDGKTVFGTCPQCEGTGYSKYVRCNRCKGNGRVGSAETLRIAVPASSIPGREIRVRGKGHAGAFGGEDGDLIVRLTESKESGSARDGEDLRVTVQVNLLEALGGKTVSIPTPDGAKQVKLNAGVLAGRSQRIKGLGLPKKGGGRGDLIVSAQPRIPDSLDTQAKELLEKLVQMEGWKVDRSA